MTRQEIIENLPFLANETLGREERAEVEAAVAGDAALQAELDVLRVVRRTLRGEEMTSPGEFGLARLMRGVETEAKTAARAPQPRIWQAAAAVLLAVVLGQGLLMTRSSDTAGYQLAGTPEPDFTIAIRPDAAEAGLRALMLDAGVTIIAGPSALGLYQLSLTGDVAATDARAILEGSALLESVSAAGE
jgi:hypothetical protein